MPNADIVDFRRYDKIVLMSARHNSRFMHLYAIVRLDLPLRSKYSVSVVSVFSTEEAAEAEANRLRKVNEGKQCQYEVLVTRLKG